MPDNGQMGNEFADNLLKHFITIWLQPEVRRRLQAGQLDGDTKVWAAQAVLDPVGGGLVRINEEVNGEFTVRPGVEEHLVLTHENFHLLADHIIGFNLPADDSPNAGHITVMWHRNGFYIHFDLLYNGQLIAEHINAAREFLDIARAALQSAKIRAAVSNLHIAVEGMAKATLLRHPDGQLLTSKKHTYVSGEYNLYSHHGNTDRRFAQLLNHLGKARNSARYPTGNFDVSAAQVSEWLSTAEEMYEWLVRAAPVRTRLKLLDRSA